MICAFIKYAYNMKQNLCDFNEKINHTSLKLSTDDLVTGKYYTGTIVRVNIHLTRLGQLGANISPDRSSLTPQVLIGNFLFNPFVVCHKYWEKLYELQHINLLSLYLPKEDGVSPDVDLFIWGFTSLSTLYRSYHDG